MAVALIVIGPEQMPVVLRAAAKVMRELRAASNEVMRELSEALEDQPPRFKPPVPANPPESVPDRVAESVPDPSSRPQDKA